VRFGNTLSGKHTLFADLVIIVHRGDRVAHPHHCRVS
jgi:hypothetical protein